LSLDTRRAGLSAASVRALLCPGMQSVRPMFDAAGDRSGSHKLSGSDAVRASRQLCDEGLPGTHFPAPVLLRVGAGNPDRTSVHREWAVQS